MEFLKKFKNQLKNVSWGLLVFVFLVGSFVTNDLAKARATFTADGLIEEHEALSREYESRKGEFKATIAQIKGGERVVYPRIISETINRTRQLIVDMEAFLKHSPNSEIQSRLQGARGFNSDNEEMHNIIKKHTRAPSLKSPLPPPKAPPASASVPNTASRNTTGNLSGLSAESGGSDSGESGTSSGSSSLMETGKLSTFGFGSVVSGIGGAVADIGSGAMKGIGDMAGGAVEGVTKMFGGAGDLLKGGADKILGGAQSLLSGAGGGIVDMAKGMASGLTDKLPGAAKGLLDKVTGGGGLGGMFGGGKDKDKSGDGGGGGEGGAGEAGDGETGGGEGASAEGAAEGEAEGEGGGSDDGPPERPPVFTAKGMLPGPPGDVDALEYMGQKFVPSVTSTLLVFLLGVSVIMVIIGGAYYLLSSGDSDMVTKGRDTVAWAILGTVVGILAYTIVKFVIGIDFLGSEPEPAADASYKVEEAAEEPAADAGGGGETSSDAPKAKNKALCNKKAPNLPASCYSGKLTAQKKKAGCDVSGLIAPICKDLGLGSCSVSSIQSKISSFYKGLPGSCSRPDGKYGQCTVKALNKYYASQCK